MKTEITSSGGSGEKVVGGGGVGGGAGGGMPVERAVETVEIGGFAAVSAAEALGMALSPPQRKAIELLTSGHTAGESAKAAGVNRTTLYRWLKGDAVFVAAFNAWQQDALATARGRLLALSDMAVAAVGKALVRGDAKTAVAVLKSLGVMDRPVVGPTDVEEVKLEQDLARRKRKVMKQKEVNDVEELEAFPPI